MSSLRDPTTACAVGAAILGAFGVAFRVSFAVVHARLTHGAMFDPAERRTLT